MLMDKQADPYLVWRFEDAPESYQRLSHFGGEEAGVAVIPEEAGVPLFLEKMWDYEVPQVVALPDGRRVYIWQW